MNVFKELAKFNIIKYHDAPHKYFIGEQELISGTAFVGMYKEKFDSEGQSVKSAKKRGISVKEMLDEWEFKSNFSRTKGTLLHNYAENYWQNKIFPIDYVTYEEMFGEGLMKERLSECIRMFEEFYYESRNTLIPIALELVVGDEELGLGGMVDGLFWSVKMNGLIIIDYKTSKEINEFSKFRKRMKAPLNFLHECELVAYSIQLNLYKFIIEKNTNLKILGCFLIHIHEEQERYNIVECHEYQEIIKLLMNDFLLKKKV